MRFYVIAITAGLLSGLMFKATQLHSPIAIMSLLAALPLFMAGLSSTHVHGAIAAVTGTAVIAALSMNNPLQIVAYAGLTSIPVTILLRLAMQWRILSDQNGLTLRVWYPADLLASALTIIGAVTFLCLMSGFYLAESPAKPHLPTPQTNIETTGNPAAEAATTPLAEMPESKISQLAPAEFTSLEQNWAEMVQDALGQAVQVMQSASQGNPLTEQELLAVQSALDVMTTTLANAPALPLIVNMIVLILMGLLAQRIVLKMGKATRPPLSAIRFSLPDWLIIVTAICGVAGYLLPGDLGFLARNTAFVLAVPFFLAGLSLLHVWINRSVQSPVRSLLFFLIYMTLLCWPSSVIAVLILLGLFDQWVPIRQKLAQL